MSYAPIPSSSGHRRRLREKFYLAGAEHMLDYEVLELLLTFSIHRRDVKPLAKALIHRFGGLRGVMDAPFDELKRFEGIGEASATLLKLVRQLGNRYLAEKATTKQPLTSPRQVVDMLRMRLLGLPHEAFMVVFLNVQNEVLKAEIIQQGTIDQVAVYPRRVVEKALEYHAGALILAHNHPSGHVQPSEEDKRLTRAIRDAARLIDVRVVDHIVIGADDFFSFSEHGLCS